MKRRREWVLLITLGVFLFSCENPAGGGASSTAPHTVTITGVGYYIDSVPVDWWSSTDAIKPNLIYNFTLQFSGTATQQEFSSARVYLPGDPDTYWTLDLPACLDFTAKTISNTGFYLGSNPKELPIGDLTAEIVLTNGKSATYVFTMGTTGSTTAGSKQYIYSADDEATATYPSVSVPALRRPTVTSLTNNGTLLQTSFTIVGSNVANGRAWFYDAADKYVGKSALFRDAASGTATARLSGGVFQNGDGQTNTLSLGAGDLTDSAGNVITAQALASIAHCRIYVIDGAQYSVFSPPSYGSYDYRAISSYY